MSDLPRQGAPPAPFLFRTLDILVLAALFALTGVLSLRRIADSDLWGHLACGSFMLDSGTLLTTHRFNCSWPDFPYVDHSWLFQVVVAAVERLAGEPGLIALQMVLVLLAFWILERTARLWSGNRTLVAAVLALGVLASMHRFALRPQHFTYVFLLYFLYSLHRYQRGERRYAYALPLVMLLWSNMHAECLWGILVLTGFLVVEWWKRRKDRAEAWRSLRPLAVVYGAVWLASFINPFTVKTVFWPFFVMSEQFAGVEETLPPASAAFAFFWAWFALVALTSLVSFRTIDPTWAALSAGFAVVAWSANRGIPHFVFASAPLLVGNIASLVERFRRAPRPEAAPARAVSSAVVITVLAGVIASIVTSPRYLRKYDGIVYPEGALKFLREQEVAGNVFNEHRWGGFIIWNSYPALRPYIDGRFFQKRFYDEYYPLMGGQPGWEQVFDRDGIDIAVLVYSPDDRPRLNDRLFGHPRWRLVYWDDACLVYVRADGATSRIAGAFGNDLVNPDRALYAQWEGTDRTVVERVLAVAERNLAAAGSSWKGATVAANAALALRDHERALRWYEDAVRIMAPAADPWFYYQIARCHHAAGDLAKAEAMLVRALTIVPDSRAVADFLRQVRAAAAQRGSGGRE